MSFGMQGQVSQVPLGPTSDLIVVGPCNEVEVAKQILEKPPGRMMRRRLRQRGAWGIVSHLLL